MLEAADDELRAVLEAAELAPSAPVEVGDIEWQRILHGAFDAGVAELLGVEIRGIGRQIGHGEVARVGGQEGGGPAGAVRIEPIPDNQEGVADLAPEVPQGLDDKRARDAAAEMSDIGVKIGTRPIGQCPMTACQRPRSVCRGQTRCRQVRRLRRPALRLRDLTAARGRETRIDAVDAVLCASSAVRVRT